MSDKDSGTFKVKQNNYQPMRQKIAELEQDFLQALHQKDFDVSKLEKHFLQILQHKNAMIDCLQLEKNAFHNIINLSINHNTELHQTVFTYMGELQKSHQYFADKAVDLSVEVVEQSVKIDKYQKGTKKKSEVSQQKWALAQLYFAEEIPKHKTLLSARKAAAKRAGINVNERRLIQMLPVEK